MTANFFNPFLDGLNLTTRRRATHRAEQEFAEFKGEAMEISVVKFVDKEQFVKVLMKGLKQGFTLNRAGQEMFWILMNLIAEEAMGKDEIYIPYMERFTFKDGTVSPPLSTTKFYDGLESLRTAGFIAKHRRRGWYWINPAMVWNGDRVRFVEEYQLKNGVSAGPKLAHPRAKKQRMGSEWQEPSQSAERGAAGAAPVQHGPARMAGIGCGEGS
jgi:hypothetical protein